MAEIGHEKTKGSHRGFGLASAVHFQRPQGTAVGCATVKQKVGLVERWRRGGNTHGGGPVGRGRGRGAW